VCVDNEKTLKFYNFIDKVAQQEERVFEEQIVKFQDSILPFFKNIDVDRSGAIDLQEAEPLLKHFIDLYQKQNNKVLSSEESTVMEGELFDEMDMDKSGMIDFHELKVFLTKKYDLMFRKPAANN